MSEKLERTKFVLNILRKIAITEEQSVFKSVDDQRKGRNSRDYGDSIEDLRDPFNDLEGDNTMNMPSKKSMNAKYKELKSSNNIRSRVKMPNLLTFANETDEFEVSQDFEAEMKEFIDSIGLEAYKAGKLQEAEELEAALRKCNSKKKTLTKPKIQVEDDVESLTDFSKLAKVHERPKGFPITKQSYNILKDSDQLEWLQRKSVPNWSAREDSKRKCLKWLKQKT